MSEPKPVSTVQFDPSDFPLLWKESQKACQYFLEQFPPIPGEKSSIEWEKADQWPMRWFAEIEGIVGEIVLSEMGSFTIRMAKSDRYRRNPPALFYASLGKNGLGGLQWEDPERNPFTLLGPEGNASIKRKIQFFKENPTF